MFSGSPDVPMDQRPDPLMVTVRRRNSCAHVPDG
ncbi:hypothetical protein Ae263Ps1_3940c [Pseudonocardia sp. Ae263_Ps1]|nr:hypothetical protein Ae150APs1_1379 [Pseudonocardia sp. Ae150A_Ps1]OLL86885.1 hypothetical protein Ae263Ps1_3940c [Pseudonocardia sp. Ae263_Ps1]OLL93070.1 hypothetical protein Ae356Ps1_2967 [Pseudonocardia sp. Ae356_Ps1]